jgi:hypothetical protein
MNSSMKYFDSARESITCIVSTALIASLMLGLASSGAFAAEPEKKEATAEKPTPAQLQTWRQTLAKTPRPKKACYTATYPDTAWHEAPCKPKSTKLYPPRRGKGILPEPEVVGGFMGVDLSAQVTGHISEAEGSFDTATKVVGGECSVPCDESADTCAANLTCSSPGATANSFSLQLNTQFFTNNKICSTAPAAGTWGQCTGWQQFTYDSEGGGSIQYWLAPYGPTGSTCPPGFTHFTPYTDAVYCYDLVDNSTPVPSADAGSLMQITVTGSAAGVKGPTDTLTLFVGGKGGSSPGDDLFTDLSSVWQIAEFNVFGNGSNSQAVFGSGSTVVPRVGVNSGTTAGPQCDLKSFTGETNNLTLDNTPPTKAELIPAPGVTPMPALVFAETNPPPAGALAVCADAASIGDTHLTTFDGLKYDFQATGDFLLAQSGDMTVQTRQALSATNPNWIKNAAITKAVAVQMGTTRVALYIWPVRIVVDGRTTDLAEGKTISLPSGVNIGLRRGFYIIASSTGDAVFVTANNNKINTWLDVTVGFGHTPVPDARGLLGNPGGNAHDLKTADGAVLKAVSFADLYQRYAESWRLQPNQSMLEADPTVKAGVPEKPFSTSDLDAQSEQKARAACVKAGVTAPALLEDCTLDTAVLGDETATKVFARLRAPRAVLPRPKL